MLRLDTIDGPKWMTSKFEKTPEGYLKGRAIICTTGVYNYVRADGTIERDLRLADEVFAPEFLESLKLKPVTLGHPTENVTVENVKAYQVGNLGNNPSDPRDGTTDHYNLSIDMIIQDKQAIEDILSGKNRALSVGYTCDLEEATKNAVWCGVPYDVIQRNLRANHVSLVPIARAGDSAKIRLDSKDAILIQAQDRFLDANISIREEVPHMENLKSINLDGVEYKAEAKVLETLNQVQKTVETLQTEITTHKDTVSKVEAERDNLQARVDSLTEENKTLKAQKIDEAEIQKRVKQFTRVTSVADKVGVEVKDEMSELDIMNAVILAKFPKASLEGKDEVYIRARFDGVEEILNSEEQVKADSTTRVAGTPPVLDQATASGSAEASRQKMIERLRNASRNKKE